MCCFVAESYKRNLVNDLNQQGGTKLSIYFFVAGELFSLLSHYIRTI